MHPSGIVIPLKAVFAPDDCEFPGFLGLELYTMPDTDTDGPRPRFTIGGPAGNLRDNEKGERLGDGIMCLCPAGDIPVRRSVDFPPKS
jgi:hypothetical protein